jgi:hypothetical protein
VKIASLAAAVAALAAVLSNRISAWLRIPAPAIFLVCAAAASEFVPALGGLSTTAVQRIVTVALAVVLFDAVHGHQGGALGPVDQRPRRAAADSRSTASPGWTSRQRAISRSVAAREA